MITYERDKVGFSFAGKLAIANIVKLKQSIEPWLIYILQKCMHKKQSVKDVQNLWISIKFAQTWYEISI